MKRDESRRRFLGQAALGLGAAAIGANLSLPENIFAAEQQSRGNGSQPRRATPPLSISSANGVAAVTRAVEEMRKGADTLDAVIAGVNIVELDPKDNSVGYGGLPNEPGGVGLDASVMHGPTPRAGAVGSLPG